MKAIHRSPKHRPITRAAALLASLLYVHLAVSPAPAESLSPRSAQQITAQQLPLRPDEVRRFFDHTLNVQLALNDIPGAVIAFVQGGDIVHLGAYGHTDLQQREPISAEATLFRAGSVSKLFTWTAVMQLVEQGKLDLHADINQYLPSFQIPATYTEPVTLARLLTHTAGFEDRVFGYYRRTAVDLLPLGAFVESYMPARIFPPGEVSAYSNYGASLAGHVVERLSGVSFEDYVETHILAPLGMAGSSFRQPLPPQLAAQLATGYRASLEPGDFELDLAVPAGALSATAADMALFMIAHLQKGRFGSVRILAERTVEFMQQRQFTNHPAVSGLTFGFQELDIASQRILTQPGDMLHFTSALFLLPEHDLGLYVAFNRGRAADVPMELLHAFLGRFFPFSPWLQSAPLPMPDSDVTPFAGSYRSTRRNETSLEKLQEFFSPVSVRVAGPGLLHVSGLAVIPDSVWTATEPGVFRDLASPEILAFRKDKSGRITHLFEGSFPTAGYTRLPWYSAPKFHYALLAICLMLFLLTPIHWAINAFRYPSRSAPSSEQQARLVAGTMCLVNLLFLTGMAVVIAQGHELLFGITPLARAVLLLPLLSAVLTGLIVFLAVIAWRRDYWTLPSRLYYSLLSLFGLAFVATLHYWNLMGLRF